MMKLIMTVIICLGILPILNARNHSPAFKVIAFFTAKNDAGHISFVHEANEWFRKTSKINHFEYDTTSNWNNLDSAFMETYQVVIFLDTRPDSKVQRVYFERYMKKGGAWMGFHFCAFAMSNTAYPQNWDWYHSDFLGSGEYRGNTWRPTKAVLKMGNRRHPVTRHLPKKIVASPNEWYSWQNDLRLNPDIEILASIDASSFPLGTGPKAHEIWNSGYYPVVWTNKNYRMIYFNMGHNDIDYEGHTNKELSATFSSKNQDKMIIEALMWLGKK